MIADARTYPAHTHTTLQISLVESAAPAWLHVESPEGRGVTQHIPPGPVLVCIPAGQPHGTTWSGPAAIATMQVPAAEVERLVREDQLCRPVSATVALAPAARSYAHAWSLPPALRTLALSAILPEVMRTAFGARPAAPRPVGERLSGRQIGQVVEWLGGHLATPASVHDIASTLRMSAAHFARSFRRTLGVSPYRFVLLWRAAYAERLLTQTTLPLRDVALLSGHADQSHLTHRIRAATGRTPGQIRAAIRRNLQAPKPRRS